MKYIGAPLLTQEGNLLQFVTMFYIVPGFSRVVRVISFRSVASGRRGRRDPLEKSKCSP